MSLTGKTLGDKGRYEIRTRIGGGGMAEVYLAQDTLLEREVAVKVLRGEYVNDEEFIAKFRREAQSAARLSHPNIVSIYDVGTDGNIYYIIMEYIQGETLKEKLAGGAFSPDKTLSTALQIALALQHAHANGIIHCDIKPHNILINKQGTVKVTDFGIARAVSSATMAHTATIMGSVHYISPEQAQGTTVSKQSDVYSLGVVMYECLTGKVPFYGDTPVSVALKHIQEEPAGVKYIKPEIPAIVDAIVAKAMAKQPSQRYAAVDELIHDIKLAKSYLKEADTAKINNADFVTQVIPVAPKQPAEKAAASAAMPAVKSSGKSRIMLALVLILIMVGGFMIGAFLAFGKFWSGSDVVVPNVAGKQVDIARNMLLSQNLRVSIEDGFSATVPLGYVISQYPEAGMAVKEQRSVTLVVSKGGENTIVPDLKGFRKSEALAALKDAGLDLGSVAEVDSGDGEAGIVSGQSPAAGAKTTKGQKVDIQVNRTSAKVTVPNVKGLNKNDAAAALSGAGLKLGAVSESAGGEAGKVISQSPEEGAEISKGGAVNVTVGGSAGKSSNISYTVPAGADKQKIKIVVNDDNGSRTVYEGTNKPGDVISKNVSVSGSATIQVLLNGNVVKELNV